jgi:site-specific DNA recombinase
VPSANGSSAGPKKAVLYARVSTEEQARSGYSLRQQMERLRAYAASEGYEVVEEVEDAGQSGASLERPGMDRVRDLVSGGGISAVLAQDRDRFAREPAYLYLLREEFSLRGCALRGLNDHGDGSPEGQLADGIMDQIARFERLKTAERTRRGKLQRAREGKIVPTRLPNYGFRFNNDRTNYLVDGERMGVVRRVMSMAAEGVAVHGIKRALDADGVPTASGGPHWHCGTIESFVLDDLYRPHTFSEVSAMVSPRVAATLDPEGTYGIWWYNRKRIKTSQVSEVAPDGSRVYRKKRTTSRKDRSEWIAVPVPDAGIPLQMIEAARGAVRGYKTGSRVRDRFYELSGAVARCGICGRAMVARPVTYKLKRGGTSTIHYYRCSKAYGYSGRCEHTRVYRAEQLEGRVWDLVLSLLRDPDRLRAAMDRLIDAERLTHQGDPEREARAWMNKIAEADRTRSRFQDMAAEGLISFDELRGKLASLEEAGGAARRELDALSERRARLAELEGDRAELLATYSGKASAGLDLFTSEERHQTYKKLRLVVLVRPNPDDPKGDLEATGVLKEVGQRNSLSKTTPHPAVPRG